MYRRARRTNLIALTGPAYCGPARREGPDDSGDPNPQGGGGGQGDGGKPTDDTGSKPKITGEVDPDRVARTIAAARDGETKAKQAAQAAKDQHQQVLDGIAVALGFKPDPKTDPTQLVSAAAKERDDAVAAARAKTVELAVYRAAGKAGADADALLDSRTFLGALDGLDPAASDFGDKVVEAIKAAAKANPKLASAPKAPGKSGAEITGGTGDGERITEEQLASMSPEAIDKALKAGKLAHLL
jgi:hypothetical protein